MPDPVNLALASTAAVVALAAGWLRRRRDPPLDGERWFKLTLATLARGTIEAGGGDADAWEALVLRTIPYHPAGRMPELKVANPAAEPPGKLREGEAGLLAQLRTTDDRTERWAILYDRDEHAVRARLEDPFELGPEYHPSRVVPGTDWDTLASWGAGDAELHTPLVDNAGATWVWVKGDEPPRLGPHLAALVPGLVTVPSRPASQLTERMAELLDQPERRLVMFGEGDALPALLQLLADHAGLRDRVQAVVSAGGVIGGRTDHAEGPLSEATRSDWMQRWFGQQHLDTAEVRLTPYISMQWLDRDAWPPGTAGLPLQHQRFGEPAEQGAQHITLESVDLGPLPHRDGLDDRLVAKALLFVVSAWVVARR